MESLIQVFRMNELSVKTRVRVIKTLGNAIDNQMCMNATEALVIELCLALDPEIEAEFRDSDRYGHTYKSIYV